MKARFEMRVPFTTRLDLDHEHGAKFTVQLLAWWKSMVEIVEVGGKFTRACGFARPRYLRIRVRGLDEVSTSFV